MTGVQTCALPIFLGEVPAHNVINVRTSFIAPDQGLWAYALSGEPLVGWSGVHWSGSTVGEVADGIVELAVDAHGCPFSLATVPGVVEVEGKLIVHLATEGPISKYDALAALVSYKPVRNEPFPVYSRALAPTRTIRSLIDALADVNDTKLHSPPDPDSNPDGRSADSHPWLSPGHAEECLNPFRHSRSECYRLHPTIPNQLTGMPSDGR